MLSRYQVETSVVDRRVSHVAELVVPNVFLALSSLDTNFIVLALFAVVTTIILESHEALGTSY